jgi:hypothetical protein
MSLERKHEKETEIIFPQSQQQQQQQQQITFPELLHQNNFPYSPYVSSPQSSNIGQSIEVPCASSGGCSSTEVRFHLFAVKSQSINGFFEKWKKSLWFAPKYFF